VGVRNEKPEGVIYLNLLCSGVTMMTLSVRSGMSRVGSCQRRVKCEYRESWYPWKVYRKGVCVAKKGVIGNHVLFDAQTRRRVLYYFVIVELYNRVEDRSNTGTNEICLHKSKELTRNAK
jgi:hypothetical protein